MIIQKYKGISCWCEPVMNKRGEKGDNAQNWYGKINSQQFYFQRQLERLWNLKCMQHIYGWAALIFKDVSFTFTAILLVFWDLPPSCLEILSIPYFLLLKSIPLSGPPLAERCSHMLLSGISPTACLLSSFCHPGLLATPPPVSSSQERSSSFSQVGPFWGPSQAEWLSP